ncbi:MAG: PAS domain-containing protein, partial [Cyanobacteria bacterium J06632_3]
MSLFWPTTRLAILSELLAAAGTWGLAFLTYRLVRYTQHHHTQIHARQNALSNNQQHAELSPELPDFIFQQAIEHAAGGLVICDAQQPDFPIVYVSPSFETLTGYTSDEVIGKNCRFLQGEETNQLGTKDIRQALSSGTGCKVLIHNYRKNGQPFWNELTISPLIDPEGVVTHYVGALIDISHYLDTFKALQQSEARYRHLYEEQNKAKENLRRSEALLRAINNLPPTGIFVMDYHTHEALFINSEFYRIWQLEHLQAAVVNGDISGEQLLTECLSNIDLGEFVAMATAKDLAHDNKIVEDEVPLLDGRTLRRIYGPIKENNTTFAYLYIFEDITERKQAVQALAHATEAAEAANRAKSEFLTNMSHELRSPLNAILGFTHILQNTQPDPEQRENLDIIYSSGEHLLALINDILDISKIEAGRVVLTESEFDLYRLVDELQQMFGNAVSQKDLRLIVERSHSLPRIIRSDRLKIRQVLINLLSNAVKFTATGSVTLKINTQEPAATAVQPNISTVESTQSTATQTHNTQTLTFSVIDTGPGIPPEETDRLFEAFVQTEAGLT